MSNKPYEENEYIKDIFSLVDTGAADAGERIRRADMICDRLRRPMCDWQLRGLIRFVFFGGGLALGALIAIFGQ